jgi:hypothetical protein
MSIQARYRCNDPDVIYEIYDDEVVVLNFSNGNYYSLKNSAKSVWILIVRGASLSEIQKHFTDKSNSHKAEIEKSISDFFISLIEEELIVDTGGKSLKNITLGQKTDTVLDVYAKDFPPPILEKFTEMQELLLLDPIHEVSDMGWPLRKKKTPQ